MDVARPLPEPLEDDEVDELDHRRFLHQPAQGLQPQFLMGVGLDLLDHRLDVLVQGGVLRQDALEPSVGNDDGLDLLPGVAADVVQRHDVERVDHAHPQLPVVEPQRDDLVPARQVLRQGQQRLLLGKDVVEVHVLEAQLLGHGLSHGLLGRGADADEDLAEALVAVLLQLDRLGELHGGDLARLHEHLTERPSPSRRHSHRGLPPAPSEDPAGRPEMETPGSPASYHTANILPF